MDPVLIGTLGSLVLSIIDRLQKQGWTPSAEENEQITALRKALVKQWDDLGPTPPVAPGGV